MGVRHFYYDPELTPAQKFAKYQVALREMVEEEIKDEANKQGSLPLSIAGLSYNDELIKSLKELDEGHVKSNRATIHI